MICCLFVSRGEISTITHYLRCNQSEFFRNLNDNRATIHDKTNDDSVKELLAWVSNYRCRVSQTESSRKRKSFSRSLYNPTQLAHSPSLLHRKIFIFKASTIRSCFFIRRTLFHMKNHYSNSSCFSPRRPEKFRLNINSHKQFTKHQKKYDRERAGDRREAEKLSHISFLCVLLVWKTVRPRLW
jgi:hypothetical protein